MTNPNDNPRGEAPFGTARRSLASTNLQPACCGGPRRAGGVLLYTILCLPLCLALALLAMDYGRVQLTKTELRRACDGAARYAVTGIGDGTALSKAQWIASQNPVSEQPLGFTSADVEVGSWDTATSTFTAGGMRLNAVRVSSSRTVQPLFAEVLGVGPKQITVRAVAKFNVTGFGVVGLNGIYMAGNTTASYWSSGGPPLAGNGNVGSNGNIYLGGSSTINGDAYYGPSKSVSGGSVTGTKTVLTTPLSFPAGDASPYSPSNNDNNYVPNWATPASSFKLGSNKVLSLPGGNYYFNNFDIDGGGELSFLGPATIYCYGTFSMSGNTSTSSSKPGNLKIIMVPNPYNGDPPGSVTVSSSAALYATVYAPQSAVSLSGTGDIYGSVLGLYVSMTGSSAIHYDMSLDVNNGTISLVE
jgi:Flp pilus assembly protein TadG